MRQLTTTVERYATVFRQLGLHCTLDAVGEKRPHEGKKRIGIAPFATYREKMYPIEKMERVIAALSGKAEVLLFGGGKNEVAMLNDIGARYPGVQVIAGKYGLKDELTVIRDTDVMVSMDSANMHLASLFAVPVVSVWGLPIHMQDLWDMDSANRMRCR
ncbi:hypothetical protein MKQ70_35750 [Chitinophaga sedimenti]|uniref:glycosyltransferase family 9 protein n=1 Tax=Chitinophaga sedimenti TaxID=2033606 RepID=UPI0020054753|nr:glycosyltransferase family 9 protein [Chitinophaga sedimenti]MCK7559993.1 hypothetical protein [Chitinophaga sedimenti]